MNLAQNMGTIINGHTELYFFLHSISNLDLPNSWGLLVILPTAVLKDNFTLLIFFHPTITHNINVSVSASNTPTTPGDL